MMVMMAMIAMLVMMIVAMVAMVVMTMMMWRLLQSGYDHGGRKLLFFDNGVSNGMKR